MNRNHLHKAKVHLPADTQTQKNLAVILKSFDDKIKLNRQMNATLESMAQALFRDWFVDFGPVRVRMAQSASDAKNKHEPREPYLVQKVWNLFPDKLDEDGKPEGWEASTIGDEVRADYILANPPFNISDWGGDRLREDVRWKFGIPPAGNANFAWLSHTLHHLSPTGTAGVVLANGSMSSTQSGEGDIRKAMIEGEVIDCMIALPGQLFYSTQIPVCLWFLAKDKSNGIARDKQLRDRRGAILFIDARKLGVMVDRTRREFTDDDIARITDTYHRWRKGRDYQDVPGFCKSAGLEEVRANGHVLTPGRYVGTEAIKDDGVPFGQRFAELRAKLDGQFAEAEDLTATIRARLAGVAGQ